MTPSSDPQNDEVKPTAVRRPQSARRLVDVDLVDLDDDDDDETDAEGGDVGIEASIDGKLTTAVSSSQRTLKASGGATRLTPPTTPRITSTNAAGRTLSPMALLRHNQQLRQQEYRDRADTLPSSYHEDMADLALTKSLHTPVIPSMTSSLVPRAPSSGGSSGSSGEGTRSSASQSGHSYSRRSGGHLMRRSPKRRAHTPNRGEVTSHTAIDLDTGEAVSPTVSATTKTTLEVPSSEPSRKTKRGSGHLRSTSWGTEMAEQSPFGPAFLTGSSGGDGDNARGAPPPPPLPFCESATTSPAYSSLPSSPRKLGGSPTLSKSPSPAVSSFKTALSKVPVPPQLLEGVNVIKVYAHGRTKSSFLTLSQDRFTIYVTSGKWKEGRWIPRTNPTALFKSLGRKVIGGQSEYEANEELDRAIDIGSIDRIQRGQSTRKFELARKAKTKVHPASSPKLGAGGKDMESTSTISSVTMASTSTRTSAGQASAASAFRRTVLSATPTKLDPLLSFSIIFRGERTLDLMLVPTATPQERDEILNALDDLIHNFKNAKVKVGKDVQLLRYIWLDVDRDKSNTINASELHNVMHRINFFMRRAQLDAAYEKFAKMIGLDRSTRRRGLTFDQCVTFLHKVKRDTWQVKPVTQIWIDSFGGIMNNGKQRTRVSAERFLQKFLYQCQGEWDATIEDVRALFVELNGLEIANVASHDVDPNMSDKYIDRDRFEAYLVSRQNDAFDPRKEMLDEARMDKPLSEYWISASHNTYLTGHQLTSQSTVEMYMVALYRGCRCVELDLWDGTETGEPGTAGSNGPQAFVKPGSVSDASTIGNTTAATTASTLVPIVYHGHTMTTKIPLADIVQTIMIFLNFNPDSYPIILSLENHCSRSYQDVVADLLVRTFGDRLYIPDEEALQPATPLPSPASLRGKVIIKGCRAEGIFTDDDTDDESDDDEKPPRTEEEKAQAKKARENVKISPKLARITFLDKLRYRNWNESFRCPSHCMHSFGEARVRSLTKSHQTRQWMTFNQSHISRTFPASRRVDSSNYNPMLAWSAGCQLVALNFQTPDAALRLNDGRFRENGGCGYVLKPPAMMTKDDVSPLSCDRLQVRVLTGSCLPKPKGQSRGECIDPYVKVSVFDVEANEARDVSRTYTTGNVVNNGFFPIWNQDWFSFRVENRNVAILQFAVWDKDMGKQDDFIASASIPISCLRQGYRSVQLFDVNNTRWGPFDFASLLIQVKMEKTQEEI